VLRGLTATWSGGPAVLRGGRSHRAEVGSSPAGMPQAHFAISRLGGRAQEGQNIIPRWLIRSAISVFAILLFALTAREFPVLAVLVALLGGLLDFFSWSRAFGEWHLCCPKRNEASTNASCETYSRQRLTRYAVGFVRVLLSPGVAAAVSQLPQAPYPLAPGSRTACYLPPNRPAEELLPCLAGVRSASTNGDQLSSIALARG